MTDASPFVSIAVLFAIALTCILSARLRLAVTCSLSRLLDTTVTWAAMSVLLVILSACGGGATTPTITITPLALTATPQRHSLPTALSTSSTDWTTYHRDNLRTGYIASTPDPHRLTRSWGRQLDGAVYAEPLVVGNRVIVATEGDSLYALNSATGSVQWHTHVGTPVPQSSLPCGDIDPLGITGTPVYDPATGLVFAVAEISGPAHILVGVDAMTGQVKVRRLVDTDGMDPRAHQQRSALTLANGMIYIAYGGLDGDCSDYIGRVVASRTDGQGPLLVYRVPTTREGGSGHRRGQLWIQRAISTSRSATVRPHGSVGSYRLGVEALAHTATGRCVCTHRLGTGKCERRGYGIARTGVATRQFPLRGWQRWQGIPAARACARWDRRTDRGTGRVRFFWWCSCRRLYALYPLHRWGAPDHGRGEWADASRVARNGRNCRLASGRWADRLQSLEWDDLRTLNGHRAADHLASRRADESLCDPHHCWNHHLHRHLSRYHRRENRVNASCMYRLPLPTVGQHDDRVRDLRHHRSQVGDAHLRAVRFV